MNIPEVGDTITTDKALELCQSYGFQYLVDRLAAAEPGQYKDWKFDGASMIPDKLFKIIIGVPKLEEIALKHDLKYAYGEPGNDEEKRQADLEFKDDLLAGGAWSGTAQLMYEAVDKFGSEDLPFSFRWGFARTG